MSLFSFHLIVMRNLWHYCHCLDLCTFGSGDFSAYAFPFLIPKSIFHFLVHGTIKVRDYLYGAITMKVKILLIMNK